MDIKIHKIDVRAIVKSVGLVYGAVLGVLVGIVFSIQFILQNPDELVFEQFPKVLLSAGVWAIFFSIILAIFASIYNKLSSVWGGVVLSVEVTNTKEPAATEAVDNG